MQRVSFFHKTLAALTVIAVVIFAAEVKAQDAQTSSSVMAKGAWAMQFHIDNNFTLSSFQGGTLSLKRHYSASRALRFGLNLGGNFSNSEGKNPNETQAESDVNSQSIGFASEYVVYPSPEKRAKLFFGLGPSLGFSRSSQTQLAPTTQPQIRDKNNNRTWSAGLIGIIGVEWFASSHISFLAEYSSFLGYTSDHFKFMREQQVGTSGFVVTSESWRNVDSFSFGARLVNFGLSVYF